MGIKRGDDGQERTLISGSKGILAPPTPQICRQKRQKLGKYQYTEVSYKLPILSNV